MARLDSESQGEAAIAAIHATASSVDDTDWEKIVSLYDTLISLRPSPIIALNRAIAVRQRDGPRQGLDALRAIIDSERLKKYLSTMPRSGTSNSEPGSERSRSITFGLRSRSPGIRWNEDFSSTESHVAILPPRRENAASCFF